MNRNELLNNEEEETVCLKSNIANNVKHYERKRVCRNKNEHNDTINYKIEVNHN